MTPQREFDDLAEEIRSVLAPQHQERLDSLIMLHHQIVGKAVLDGILTYPVTVVTGR